MSAERETMKPDICIYHGNCADGFTAAWAVWKRFGDAVQYVPGVYGTPHPDVTGKNVVIVDFSYKRPVLSEMLKSANSILVLDHHKTAEADLGDGYEGRSRFFSMSNFEGVVDWHRYQDNLYQDDCENAGKAVYTLFDMDRSGAGIVWDFFHPGTKRPALVNYVEDRDLWKFKRIFSREINAFIFAHEYTFKNWDMLDAMMASPEGVISVGERGAAIEKKHHKDIAELVAKGRRMMRIGGHLVPVANLPYTLTSDAGHLMCKPYDTGYHGVEVPAFAACYWDTPEGRVFSLRSDDNHGGVDVSQIAKAYGGGGHKNAAGFTMPLGWEGD